MLLYVLLIVMVMMVSIFGGLALAKRQRARRREFLLGTAQLLGLQLFEGDSAYEQAKRERQQEGIPPQPLPEFLENFARKNVGPRLGGKFRGSRVTVYEEVHSTGRGSRTVSVFKAWFDRPLAFELDLRREDAGAKLAKAFGGQDVTLGDPAFDAAVRLRADPPERAAAFLAEPQRRTAVLQALRACPDARICRTHVLVSRQARLKDEEQIRSLLGAIVPVAAAFSA